jgi:hypothetical protein
MSHANIFASDQHAASDYGLWHPDAPRDSEGGRVVLNVYQSYLWECWQHLNEIALPQMCGTMERNVFLGGDTVDGVEERSACLSDDETIQVNGAVMVLSILTKGVQVRGVSGTAFHAGKSAKWDNAVMKNLGAIPDEAGRYARWQCFTQVDGVTFDLAHHIGGSYVPASRMTPLVREYIDVATSNYESDWVDAEWVLRGHSHMYRIMPGNKHTVVALPGFQGKTPLAHKQRRAIPADIGVFVVFTDEGRSWYDKKLYTWPRPKVECIGWDSKKER